MRFGPVDLPSLLGAPAGGGGAGTRETLPEAAAAAAAAAAASSDFSPPVAGGRGGRADIVQLWRRRSLFMRDCDGGGGDGVVYDKRCSW